MTVETTFPTKTLLGRGPCEPLKATQSHANQRYGLLGGNENDRCGQNSNVSDPISLKAALFLMALGVTSRCNRSSIFVSLRRTVFG